MRSLEKRLKRLENATGIDRSGRAPHSPEWLAFWKSEYQRYLAGEHGVLLTIEGVRAAMQDIDDDAE